MTQGMKFTEDEITKFLKDADPKDEGMIDIEKLADKMCPPIPES